MRPGNSASNVFVRYINLGTRWYKVDAVDTADRMDIVDGLNYRTGGRPPIMSTVSTYPASNYSP